MHVVAGVAGGVDVAVQVFEPVDEVTVYLEMPAPPLLAGAVQLTAACTAGHRGTDRRRDVGRGAGHRRRRRVDVRSTTDRCR